MTASIRPSLLAAALLGALAAAGCDRASTPPPAAQAAPSAAMAPASVEAPPVPIAAIAIARITGADDNPAQGELTFTAVEGGAHVTGTLAGLAPDSEHGFHVHETGDCSAPAGGSAGKHYNPATQPHGGPEAAARHAGDMPNLRADASGNATVDFHLTGVGVGSRDEHDLVGKAVIVHEKSDDYSTQPSGASGTPIACGIIELPGTAPAPTP
ncbi:MAG: superoxide dismutase family protein [Arenimonas sp.]